MFLHLLATRSTRLNRAIEKTINAFLSCRLITRYMETLLHFLTSHTPLEHHDRKIIFAQSKRPVSIILTKFLAFFQKSSPRSLATKIARFLGLYLLLKYGSDWLLMRIVIGQVKRVSVSADSGNHLTLSLSAASSLSHVYLPPTSSATSGKSHCNHHNICHICGGW